MADNSGRSAKYYNAELLRTVHLVPLTAYRSDGSLDLEAQAAHTARMYEAGMRVFLPAAGTSEFHNLSADEIVSLVRVTREASGSDAQIFAPVGLQLSHAIDVARRSLEAGGTGMMFMPFAHPYMSDAGAADYYRAVIDACPCPTLIYKKSSIPTDRLLLELASIPHVAGIKYAENNLHDFRRVVAADRGRIEWMCGSAERFAPYFMLAGAPGYTSGAGNLCPHLTLAMHAALTAGAWAEGMRWQQMILPIEDFRAREGDSYNIAMLKCAMEIVGTPFGTARPPQRRISETDRRQIEELLAPILRAEAELADETRRVGLASG